MTPPYSRRIEISGRTINCDSVGDRGLLTQAKAIIESREAARHLSVDRLYEVFDACRLHALGEAQHAVREALASRRPPESHGAADIEEE